MVYTEESLKFLQVTGSRAGWSCSRRNISRYPSFASCSWFSVHDQPCSDSSAVVIGHL